MMFHYFLEIVHYSIEIEVGVIALFSNKLSSILNPLKHLLVFSVKFDFSDQF